MRFRHRSWRRARRACEIISRPAAIGLRGSENIPTKRHSGPARPISKVCSVARLPTIFAWEEYGCRVKQDPAVTRPAVRGGSSCRGAADAQAGAQGLDVEPGPMEVGDGMDQAEAEAIGEGCAALLAPVEPDRSNAAGLAGRTPGPSSSIASTTLRPGSSVKRTSYDPVPAGVWRERVFHQVRHGLGQQPLAACGPLMPGATVAFS